MISEGFDLPPPRGSDEDHWVDEEGLFIGWDQVGVFRVTRTGDIRFQRAAGASDELIRVPLLGTVLAVALHYQGILVMHGNAMSHAGRGVIVVGAKGQGKSTVSAAMVGRGWQVHAEDAASISGSTPVEALRGTQQLRLWPDSLAQVFGQGRLTSRRVHEMSDKLVVPLPSSADGPSRLPLHRIYVLEDAETISTHPLAGPEAWQLIMVHSMVARFGSRFLAGKEASRHFAACMSLAKSVPCMRLLRPRTFSRLDEVVTHIEKDLASP